MLYFIVKVLFIFTQNLFSYEILLYYIKTVYLYISFLIIFYKLYDVLKFYIFLFNKPLKPLYLMIFMPSDSIY